MSTTPVIIEVEYDLSDDTGIIVTATNVGLNKSVSKTASFPVSKVNLDNMKNQAIAAAAALT